MGRDRLLFTWAIHPGRKEPTTGEINYCNILKHLYAKGYRDIIGMKHSESRPGKEGEQAVIMAYVGSSRL